MGNASQGFSRKEVSIITGIKPGTISYYVHNKFVTPDISKSSGRGVPGKFSENNLVEFLLLQELSKNGLELYQIQNIILTLAQDIFSWVRIVDEKNLQSDEVTPEQLMREYKNYKRVNWISTNFLKSNKLFLLVFDANEELPPKDENNIIFCPMKMSICAYPVEKKVKNSNEMINFIMKNANPTPPDTFSSLLLLDISKLCKKVSDKLEKL